MLACSDVSILARAARIGRFRKHAKAKIVRTSIARVNDDICITVEDDGIGFDLSIPESGLQKQRGFGIFSIRERLAHIGGQFQIESVKGKGTKVTILAPLNVERQGGI